VKKTINKFRVVWARLFGQRPDVCVDLAEWLESAESAVFLGALGAGGEVIRNLPDGAENIPRFSEERSFKTHRRVVAKVKGATLFGAEGMIMLADGRYLLQTVWYPAQLTLHPQYYRRSSHRAKKIKGVYHPLIRYWSRSYYHWMTETLPTLHGMEPFFPPETRHIIPGPASKFQLESLELLGIDASRFVEIPVEESWKVEELVISPPATTSFARNEDPFARISRYSFRDQAPFMGPFNHSPDGLRWIAKRLTAGAFANCEAEPAPPRRIYITRRRANSRRLNEAELAAVLERHGIVTCELEAMPLAAQVRLFHQAELVVAPHGAGLSNLMFCKPGTRVIEIFEPSVIRLCYWSISDLFRLDYHFLVGGTVASGGPEPDINVEPAKLACLLESLCPVQQTIG
jgi:capsular polysaccharide biosynthesis protein